MTKIRDITQKYGADFIRLRVIDLRDKRFALQIEKQLWTEKFGERLRIETSTKRLEELANEILNYLNKKVKWEEWKPTMDDLEQRLEEVCPEWGIENWFIDMIRTAVALENKSKIRQVRRIYEWIKSNEVWLYALVL